MLPSILRLAAAAFLSLAVAGCASNSMNRTADSSVNPDDGMVNPVAYAPSDQDQATLAKPYFISFRARNAESYGHTFVVIGKLDASGHVPYDSTGTLVPSMTEVAGLHPASTSVVPYMIGHIVPVPSETGASDGDTERAYLLAEWTVPLTAAQYQDVSAYIHKLQDSSPVWSAVAYNCSAFVGDIAKHMGYKAPNSLLLPKSYIEELRAMNT
ncbi:hypothetical protein [Jiella mangrovi]|uniref:Lipoprotein n=1 Tax=Jiella mangrovi TaxID=2821407 RepID=A0ABS4BHH0_9HYPH|nr:hypothetical protein [Jiella mangrovi]MBP0615514.1 hypothetical protein [Jiella mangrovi]